MSVETKIGSPLSIARPAKTSKAKPSPAAAAWHLTPREEDILRELIAREGGASNKEIAARLGLTEGTLKVYFQRLGAKIFNGPVNRVALALWAERRAFLLNGD